MASYRVQEPPTHKLSLPHLCAAVLVFAALLSLGLKGIETVPIVVNGETRQVALGGTVSDAVDAGLVCVSRGDLVDTTGTVLAVGRGERGVVLVNGRPAEDSCRLRSGDLLTTRPGADVVESVVTTRQPIPIPVEYEGSGPLVGLASPGSVGIQEVTLGEVSRHVEQAAVIEQAQPMILRRYAPDPGNKVVALTFDDGPWPESTEEICEILESEGVKGNFFMLGIQVRKHPDIARRVEEGGHLIGNHSFSHKYLHSASSQLAHAEIESAQTEIEKATGVKPTWYRPAGGIVSSAVWTEARKSDVRLITWNVDPQDYRAKYSNLLVRDVVEATEPGSVILLHDGGGDRYITTMALRGIIHRLRDEGYSFVTLDELYPEQ